MMIVLFYLSLAYFSYPSSVGLTILLWSSLADYYNNSLGVIYFSVLPLIDNLRHFLAIGDCTTCVWCETQLYRACLALAFTFYVLFSSGYYNINKCMLRCPYIFLPFLIFVLHFFVTSNNVKN